MVKRNKGCHCERPEGAKQSPSSEKEADCFVASLLAMTISAFFTNLVEGGSEAGMR